MYCDKCRTINENNSKFCINCGSRLFKGKKHKTEEVLFIPESEKSRFSFKRIIIGFLIGCLALFSLIVIAVFVSNLSSSQTNESSFITDETFPLSSLNLKDLDSEWSGYGSSALLYIKGTLSNNDSKSAKNVQLRIDFYKDQAENDLFDTRYITLPGVSYYGAYTFKEPIYSFSADGKFWYKVSIVSAESQ